MAESNRVRFGIFEFDPVARELWREGVSVRLQAQPAQALALLIAHAGTVVARETLRRELWGGETFVDFDRGLNFCIAQIRAALGDSAESPRFVRTLPKRGYQFIAPVAIASTSAPAPNPLPNRGPRRLVAAAAILVAALAVGGLWRLTRPKAFQPPIIVAVTRFDNETGNAAFSRLADTLTDSVVGELTVVGGGHYGIIGNAAVLRAPREGRDLLAIGAALKAGYIVIGQVQADGDGLRILAHLIRLPDQKHLWVVREQLSPALAGQPQSELARRIASEFSRHLDAERDRLSASHEAVIR